MIQAVSSLKVGNSKGTFSNYQGNSNYKSSSAINHSADTFSKSKNISFTGLNPLGLIKGKGNLASEAIGVTKKIAKELPVVKKSLIAAASDLIHIVGDGQGVFRVPLEDISVAKETILDANNIIVPHIENLASEAMKEGVSAAGHEAVGAIAEGAGTSVKEHAGHGLIEGIKETIKEIITNI